MLSFSRQISPVKFVPSLAWKKVGLVALNRPGAGKNYSAKRMRLSGSEHLWG
jgi:hypothetical protein